MDDVDPLAHGHDTAWGSLRNWHSNSSSDSSQIKLATQRLQRSHQRRRKEMGVDHIPVKDLACTPLQTQDVPPQLPEGPCGGDTRVLKGWSQAKEGDAAHPKQQ
jgi:hypothetical protein